jgi:hypothetical protein
METKKKIKSAREFWLHQFPLLFVCGSFSIIIEGYESLNLPRDPSPKGIEFKQN